MVFQLLIIIVVGLSFGSFASVVIHRLHQREGGILFGRSKCPECQRQLNVRDLIPVISYLMTGHKCRYCEKPISARYPLLEMTMGAAFLTTFLQVGLTEPLWLGYWLLLTFIFVLLSFYDIYFQEIPDEISLPTIVLTGIVGYFGGLHTGASLLTAFAVPVGFFSLLFFGSRGKWIGGGDIRLGAIMGFVTGWPTILVALFIGYFVGAVFSLGGMATGKLSRKSVIPFGPFLLLDTYIAVFWGQDILNWYTKLL